MTTVINSTDATFKSDVIESDVPVLLDFWAPWCGPCKAIAPVLENVAEHYGEKVKVVKVDVDENPEISAHFRIRGIPALFVFKDGEMVENLVGQVLQTKPQFTEILDKHL